MEKTKRPIAKITHGAVQIAIWEQAGQFGAFYTLTPSYSYKKDDQWHTTSSFPADSALALSKAFEEAYDKIRVLKTINDTPLSGS